MTKRFGEFPNPRNCHHLEHNPPDKENFAPGYWEHECPNCHHRQTFSVLSDFQKGFLAWSAAKKS
jgi:hypothetical protein